ncbi:MAG: YicC/YloC family endoribonuclease [Alphaproteobacteria bacterium]
MSIASMTGFARAQGTQDGYSWAWEIRAVNARGLEARFRLPAGFDPLEPEFRAELGRKVSRGALNLALTWQGPDGNIRLKLNDTAFGTLMGIVDEIRARGQDIAPPRLDGLLQIRGVLDQLDESPDLSEILDDMAAPVRASLQAALDDLVAARREEGKRIAEKLQVLVASIVATTEEVELHAARQPELISTRLLQKLAELAETVPDIPEERVAQEAALQATKADVREEIDRLKAHLASLEDLLGAGGAVGRRLDFLCQELNREANTICSKSADLKLTQAGLALKAFIEQFREQVQNIE